MRIGYVVLFSLALLSLSACSYWRNMTAKQDFDDSSREYNRLVRWQEPEQACQLYVDKAIREQFLAKVQAAKEVKIVDYRVKSVECEVERNEATAKVELDYYIPPSIQIKTLEDTQKWVYVEENGNRFWQLKSLFPEFK